MCKKFAGLAQVTVLNIMKTMVKWFVSKQNLTMMLDILTPFFMKNLPNK